MGYIVEKTVCKRGITVESRLQDIGVEDVAPMFSVTLPGEFDPSDFESLSDAFCAPESPFRKSSCNGSFVVDFAVPVGGSDIQARAFFSLVKTDNVEFKWTVVNRATGRHYVGNKGGEVFTSCAEGGLVTNAAVAVAAAIASISNGTAKEPPQEHLGVA